MAEFRTFMGSWPWPWIGSYCIPSYITHRPLPAYQISLKSKKLFVDGRTDGHLRPTLLGRLGEVDLISRVKLRYAGDGSRRYAVLCDEENGANFQSRCTSVRRSRQRGAGSRRLSRLRHLWASCRYFERRAQFASLLPRSGVTTRRSSQTVVDDVVFVVVVIIGDGDDGSERRRRTTVSTPQSRRTVDWYTALVHLYDVMSIPTLSPPRRCHPNGTKLCWPAVECYRRRQTTTDAREHH